MDSIGPYDLIRLLGTGGMGEVWMGRRTTLGGATKVVAVKILARERVHDANARKMFFDEARLSMLLTSANIVQVFDVGEDQGTCYMAMEWVDGLDLSDVTERLRGRGQRLPVHIVAHIIGEILKALAYAHELRHQGECRAIIHRDISPHNVMLSVTGEVKLMDFGIARISSEKTSGMHVKGKLRYMPPEQLRGNSRAPTIDLFAVGAILHELLDGKPFRGGVIDEPRLYGMILDGEVDPLSAPHDVPRELDALRRGLLAPNVGDRIRTARAAFHHLTEWRGYRDAKFDLEDIVRDVATEEIDLSTSVDLPTIVDRTVLPDEHAAEPRERTQASRRGHLQTESVSVVVRKPPRTRLLFGRGLVVIGIFGCGAIAASMARAWWAGANGLDVALVPAVDPSGEGLEGSTPPEPLVPSEPTTVEPVTPIEAVPVEPLTPANTPSPAESSQTPRPPAAKVTVVIRADPRLNRFWVEVRLGGKSHAINKPATGSAVTKLKPGSYEVQYRTEVEGTWNDAGTVRIPSNGRAAVIVRGDGTALVE